MPFLAVWFYYDLHNTLLYRMGIVIYCYKRLYTRNLLRNSAFIGVSDDWPMKFDRSFLWVRRNLRNFTEVLTINCASPYTYPLPYLVWYNWTYGGWFSKWKKCVWIKWQLFTYYAVKKYNRLLRCILLCKHVKSTCDICDIT